MTENEINRLTIKAINDELSDIWTLDHDSCKKELFVVEGIVLLRNKLIDSVQSEPTAEPEEKE